MTYQQSEQQAEEELDKFSDALDLSRSLKLVRLSIANLQRTSPGSASLRDWIKLEADLVKQMDALSIRHNIYLHRAVLVKLGTLISEATIDILSEHGLTEDLINSVADALIEKFPLILMSVGNSEEPAARLIVR